MENREDRIERCFWVRAVPLPRFNSTISWVASATPPGCRRLSPPTREHFPEETLRNLPLGPRTIFSLFAFLSGSISRLLAPVSFHILLLVSHGVSQTDEQAREIPKNPRFCVFLRSAVQDILGIPALKLISSELWSFDYVPSLHGALHLWSNQKAQLLSQCLNFP